jgi:hypothetical protein
MMKEFAGRSQELESRSQEGVGDARRGGEPNLFLGSFS